MGSSVCTVLFLVAVSPVITQYHVREYAEGYDSQSLQRRPTFVGGKGIITHGKGGKPNVHPSVNYVTSASTSYGRPVNDLYKPLTSYYEKPGTHGFGGLELGGHDTLDYGLGSYGSNFESFGKGKEYAGRVRVQVYRGPTTKYGYKEYAPWGYYVIQPSDEEKHNFEYHYV